MRYMDDFVLWHEHKDSGLPKLSLAAVVAVDAARTVPEGDPVAVLSGGQQLSGKENKPVRWQ